MYKRQSFTSLNNPPNHPARSMQDTFYVDINGEDGIPYNLRPLSLIHI